MASDQCTLKFLLRALAFSQNIFCLFGYPLYIVCDFNHVSHIYNLGVSSCLLQILDQHMLFLNIYVAKTNIFCKRRKYVALDQKPKKRTKTGLKKGKLLKKGQKRRDKNTQKRVMTCSKREFYKKNAQKRNSLKKGTQKS